MMSMKADTVVVEDWPSFFCHLSSPWPEGAAFQSVCKSWLCVVHKVCTSIEKVNIYKIASESIVFYTGIQIFFQEFGASEKRCGLALAWWGQGSQTHRVTCSLPHSPQCHKNHTGKYWKCWKGEMGDDGLKSCKSVGTRHCFAKQEYKKSVVFWLRLSH